MTAKAKYRIWTWATMLTIVALVVLSILQHTRIFGYAGDDWSNFNQRTFLVSSTESGDVLEIDSGSAKVRVHLLGVYAPQNDDHFSAQAREYLTNRTVGKRITLKLEQIQSRDSDGRLLAHVYTIDKDNLNQDMIKDGCAYADRRVNHSMHTLYEAAENEARKKKTGLWKEITDQTLPAWRKDWLKSLRPASGK